MEIPSSQNLMLPLLQLMDDQEEYRISEMVDLLAREMAVEVTHGVEHEEDLISRDQKALFYSRVVGARSLLVTAKLIENPQREISKITERGLDLLKEKPLELNFEQLAQYPEFKKHLDSTPNLALDADSDGAIDDVPQTINEKNEATKESEEIDEAIEIGDVQEEIKEEVAEVNNKNKFNDFSWNTPNKTPVKQDELFPDLEENNVRSTDEYKSEEKDSILQSLPPVRSDISSSTDSDSVDAGVRTINSRRHTRRINSMQNDIDYYEERQVYEEDSRQRMPMPQKNRRLITPVVDDKPSPITLFLLGAGRYIEVFFKNKWLYLLPIFILLAGWVASLFVLEDLFTSKGILYVQSDTLIQQVSGSDSSDFGVWITPAQETKEEMDELINTNSFIRLIIQQTELEANMNKGVGAVDDTIRDVYESLSVNYVGLNNVIVESTWNDRGVAVDLATATLNSFINWKITQDKKDSQAALEFLEELVPQYEQEFQAAVNELEAFYIQHPEPFRGDRPELEQLQIDILNQKLTAADERLQEASNNLEQVRLEQVIIEGKTRQTYSIIDAPRIPIEPNGGLLQEAVNFTIFLIVGIVITLLAVAITTLVDQTLKFPREVLLQLDSEVLSVVHKEPKRRRSIFGRRK